MDISCCGSFCPTADVICIDKVCHLCLEIRRRLGLSRKESACGIQKSVVRASVEPMHLYKLELVEELTHTEVAANREQHALVFLDCHFGRFDSQRILRSMAHWRGNLVHKQLSRRALSISELRLCKKGKLETAR